MCGSAAERSANFSPAEMLPSRDEADFMLPRLCRGSLHRFQWDGRNRENADRKGIMRRAKE
jgi:hypothetical protein